MASDTRSKFRKMVAEMETFTSSSSKRSVEYKIALIGPPSSTDTVLIPWRPSTASKMLAT